MKPLSKGDRIGLVMPATAVAGPAMRDICHLIETLGFRVRVYGAETEMFGRMGGSDDARASCLHRAMTDPDVAAVLCARGGYGSGRLLDLIDVAAFEDRIFVGYSDITNLLLHINGASSRVVFHGPMGSDLTSKEDAHTLGWLTEVLSGKRLSYELPASNFSCFRTGAASGPLIGGNISILESLLGTPSLKIPDGAILFLEDVGEFMYALDRSLVHLGRAGIFEKVSGILFGDMRLKDGGARDNSLGLMLEEVLDLHFRDFEGPIAFGLPCGHTQAQMCLPIGANSHLRVTDDGLTLSFEDFWEDRLGAQSAA